MNYLYYLLIFSLLALNISANTRNTTFADLRDQPYSTSTYNEYWTYTFLLQDSLVVILNFSRVDAGKLKDPVCGSDLSILNFKGKNYTVAREYPRKNFIVNTQTEGIQVHKNIWFKGALPQEHSVYFHTLKKGMEYKVSLTFSEIAPGITFKNPEYSLPKGKAKLYLPIPRARVQGWVRINGDSLRVEGLATMDHTVQSEMGTRLIEKGFRFQTTQLNQLGYLLQPQDSRELVGFYAKRKSDGTYDLLKVPQWSIEKKQKVDGTEVPSQISLEVQGSRLYLNSKKNLQIHYVLDEFSGASRWVVKKFMGGEPFYFRSHALLGDSPAFYQFFGVK